MAIGLLAIVLEGSVTARVLSPGPVTLQHTQVGSCDGCHQEFHEGVATWIKAALGPNDGLAESKQCLSCHGLEAHAFDPHNISPKTLAAATSTNRTGHAEAPIGLQLARQMFGSPSEVTETLSCGTCHKEHRGPEANLSFMSNGQCQACHSATFASLADGHPDFGAYPYLRRTRINFDHWSHIERHFVKEGPEKSPETCTDCHVPSADGETMQVQGFDETCAACHLDQIEGEGLSGAKGIVFLTVPGLDVAALEDAEIEVGEWPEFSEQKLTPFLKTLLMEDESLGDSLARFESLDLLDLTEATPEDLAAVEQTVWALKGLLHDVLFKGMAPMGEMIGSTLGQDLARSQMSDLLGAVPLDVLRAAQEAWFPDLFREVAMRRQGMPVTKKTAEDQAGETGDETTASDAAEDGGATDEEILSDDEEILSDDEEILSDDEEILSDDGDILSDDEEILSDDGDILSDDEEILSDDGDILSDDEEILSDDGDILSDDEEIATGDDGDAEEEDAASSGTEDVLIVEDLSELDTEAWARYGGWYRIDFALYFKPTGHADSFMRSWLDLSGRAAGSDSASLGASLFEMLSHDNAPGRCAKCHGIEQGGDGQFSVDWQPWQEDPNYRQATHFSHTTHFSLLDEKGCNTCHSINPEAKYAASFEQHDPAAFASNFQPLDRKICADCHVEEEAGDACLDCHRYHLGFFPGPVVKTLMEGKQMAAGSDGAAIDQ